MSDKSNSVLDKLQQRRDKFQENSKSASDAMRLIVSALLFPTLALAYNGKSFTLGTGNLLVFPLIFFCLYFFADLFQFLLIAIAIHVDKDNKNLEFMLFYGKFVFGLIGLVILIISVIR